MIIPDESIKDYLEQYHLPLNVQEPWLRRLRMQFVQSISGSYSALLGLPLFELRQALTQLGFFD